GFVLPSHNRFARKFRNWQKCPGRPHTAGRWQQTQKKTTMKLITLFGLILLVFSCNGQRQNEDSSFSDLCENLPTITTPIVFNSNIDIQLKSVDLPKNRILNELNDKSGFSVFGKIFESKSLVTIVGYVPDDYGSPIVVTIDNKGNIIDSFSLYQSVGFDMGYYRSNFVTINSDKTISIVDSLITRKILEDGSNEIPDSDSLAVTKSRFKHAASGKIEKIE
ncbi:hypothetical protein, partial [Geofilum rubicundum]